MIALDTNFLVYAETPGDPFGRHEAVSGLLTHLTDGRTIVPLQVIGEFLNVCHKKRVLSVEQAIGRIEEYFEMFQTPATLPSDLTGAALLSARYDLQFFDALIMAVARRAGAVALLSEDMQDGLEVEGLRIVNPFDSANETLLSGLLGSAL